MNYQILNEINYETEALRLIAMHCGEHKGYRNWLKNTLERNKDSQEWLEERINPLIRLEELVFKEVSISEQDFHLYFEDKNFDPGNIGDSIAGVFSEIEHFHLGKNEEEWKKIFIGYVLSDFSYTPATPAPDAEEFFRLLQNTSMEAALKWEFLEIYCNLTDHMARVKELTAPVIRILKQQEELLLTLIHDNLPEGTPYYLDDQKFLGNLNVRDILLDFSVFGFNGVAIRILDITPDTGYLHYGIYVDALILEKEKQKNPACRRQTNGKAFPIKAASKFCVF